MSRRRSVRSSVSLKSHFIARVTRRPTRNVGIYNEGGLIHGKNVTSVFSIKISISIVSRRDAEWLRFWPRSRSSNIESRKSTRSNEFRNRAEEKPSRKVTAAVIAQKGEKGGTSVTPSTNRAIERKRKQQRSDDRSEDYASKAIAWSSMLHLTAAGKVNAISTSRILEIIINMEKYIKFLRLRYREWAQR